MIRIEEKDSNTIRVFNSGVLIIEEESYNKIVLIVKKLKEIIQDEYQLNVLDEILKLIELRMVA